LLLQGEVEQVIAAVQGICRGRNSKALRTQRDYFIKNKSRMAYAKLLAMKLPIGSVEDVETEGHFTPCSAGSLIGKMGTRPLKSAGLSMHGLREAEVDRLKPVVSDSRWFLQQNPLALCDDEGLPTC